MTKKDVPTKLPSRNEQHKLLSQQPLHYYLSVQPIYPTSSSGNIFNQGRTKSDKRSDKGHHCRGQRRLTTIAKTAPQGLGIMTLPLPAVLGRRNLVETWWKTCPSVGCQARERCRTSMRMQQQQQQQQQQPNEDWKRLVLCHHCKLLVDSRRVLALSKALLYVDQDGTIDITAKHHQLIHFDNDKTTNDNNNDDLSSKNVLGGGIANGTLSIGKRMEDNNNNDSSCLIIHHHHQEGGLWMKFQLQLHASNPVTTRQQASSHWHNVKNDKRNSNGKSASNSFPAPSQSHHQPRRRQRRRQLFVTHTGNEEDDEEDDFLRPVVPREGTFAARTLIFDAGKSMGSRVNKSDTNGSEPTKCYETMLKPPPNYEAEGNHDVVDNARNLTNLDCDATVKKMGQTTEERAIANVFQEAEGHCRTTVVATPRRNVIESPLTVGEASEASEQLGVKVAHPRTPHTRLPKKRAARLITPELRNDSGQAISAADEVLESLCRRRRLMNLDDMACTGALRSMEQGQSLAQASSEPRESRPLMALRPSSNTTDSVIVAKAGILSMPDDRSESDDEISSLQQSVSIREVATQIVTTPASDCDDKLVRDMTVSDWKNIFSNSCAGSFQKAISSLVLAKNEGSISTREKIVWIPPLLDRNARMDFVMKLGSLNSY